VRKGEAGLHNLERILTNGGATNHQNPPGKEISILARILISIESLSPHLFKNLQEMQLCAEYPDEIGVRGDL
jgi:hypothetical protein